MENEIIHLLSDKRTETARVLVALAIYCKKHRMLDVNLNNLDPEDWGVVGNQVVDLFVHLTQGHVNRTPPK